MAETDPMTINERRKYIHKIWDTYRKASKSEKSAILDQAEQVTKMHRKSLIRILNGRLSRKKRSSERGKTYGTDIQDIIHIIAKSLDYPCAERLTPCLVSMAKQIEYHHELKTDAISSDNKENLLAHKLSIKQYLLQT